MIDESQMRALLRLVDGCDRTVLIRCCVDMLDDIRTVLVEVCAAVAVVREMSALALESRSVGLTSGNDGASQ